MNGQALGLEVGYLRVTGTVVHLFGGPFVTIEGQRFDVPEGSKRLRFLMVVTEPPLAVAARSRRGKPGRDE